MPEIIYKVSINQEKDFYTIHEGNDVERTFPYPVGVILIYCREEELINVEYKYLKKRIMAQNNFKYYPKKNKYCDSKYKKIYKKYEDLSIYYSKELDKYLIDKELK